ncbi:MAG: urea ABC transporter permease subunit UrtB [Alphaproteobacteria bacterium]
MRALVFAVLALWLAAVPVRADEALRSEVDALGEGSFRDTARAAGELAATGDPAVVPVLEALRAGDLYVRREDGRVFAGERDGREIRLYDVFTGEDLGTVDRRVALPIRVNNNLRGTIDAALGQLRLADPDPEARLGAARAIFEARDPAVLPALDAALAEEANAEVRAAMELARAAIVAFEGETESARIEAVEQIAAGGDREALGLLSRLARDAPPSVEEAAQVGIVAIERRLAFWEVVQDLVFGLSLGSVLLLAAIGLAITFGVMGVINMAHGEMVMLGAYTTFVVQEVVRSVAPWLFEASLLLALPLAFLVAGGVGVLIERGVIRHLYGRPLETLLATWGVSLILQQAVRTLFGPTNRQVGTPAWMSGSVDFGDFSLTMSRVVIILFAFAVFAALIVVLRRSRFGLEMRAVTQNRAMASSMGIRTDRVDALTFGLGSGIAGIAGVALSQIENVSPNLGQAYIVDSFMVVVFGGVGSLWGTLTAAMTLGVANKLMEPWTGAVLAKIAILVFIILFIQRRPKGLFALKGRAAEA